MARLASSPWTTSCGLTRLENRSYENLTGCSPTRHDSPSTTRLRSNFLPVVRGPRRVESRERGELVAMAMAGLFEETETRLSEQEAAVKVDLTVTNLGNNSRQVVARIGIQAPLEAVWGVLTDYNHLSDHIPGLAESRVLERRPHGARLLQIGQKQLALGLKFKAKAVVEVTEEAAQDLDNGTLRDLHFDTVEGDFQIFKGTWRMHETSGSSTSETKDRLLTYLSYILEVQPKRWMPVALIEGVLGHEITCNLVSVRNVAIRNHNSKPQLQIEL